MHDKEEPPLRLLIVSACRDVAHKLQAESKAKEMNGNRITSRYVRVCVSERGDEGAGTGMSR